MCKPGNHGVGVVVRVGIEDEPSGHGMVTSVLCGGMWSYIVFKAALSWLGGTYGGCTVLFDQVNVDVMVGLLKANDLMHGGVDDFAEIPLHGNKSTIAVGEYGD